MRRRLFPASAQSLRDPPLPPAQFLRSPRREGSRLGREERDLRAGGTERAACLPFASCAFSPAGALAEGGAGSSETESRPCIRTAGLFPPARKGGPSTLLWAESMSDGLEVHVGAAPVIVVHGEDHTVEGPTITPEDADSLFREIADSRHVREFRTRGATDFFVRSRRGGRYAVRARVEADYVGFDVQRITSEPVSRGNR
jgi:hypothetical protein